MEEQDLFLSILLVGFVMILGGIVAGWAVMKNTGKRSARSYAIGIYDIIMGISVFVYAINILSGPYLSDAKESIYSLVKWFGILYAAVGAFEIFSGWMLTKEEQEQEYRKAEFERRKKQELTSQNEKRTKDS